MIIDDISLIFVPNIDDTCTVVQLLSVGLEIET